MACAAFHLESTDKPAGYISAMVKYHNITLNISTGVTLFFPPNESGSQLARALAVELTRLADELDVNLAEDQSGAADAAAREIR